MNSNFLLSVVARSKKRLFILCSMVCVMGFEVCSGQSIVGKWNQLKIKTYYTAAGAAANGNHTESVINVSEIGTGIFVFYSNHTYRQQTTTGDSKAKTLVGTWKLTGDQLELTLLAEQLDKKDNPKEGTPPETTTVSFNQKDIMEWTTTYPNDPNISKIVMTFASNK